MRKNADGLNNEKLQMSNRSLILSMIIREPAISRIELVERSALGKPAITNIVHELLSLGIIEECEKEKQEGRRKTRGLMLRKSNLKIFSGRWMRGCFKAAVYSLDGRLLFREDLKIGKGENIYHTKARILAFAGDIVARHNEESFLGMCIGVSGPYIHDEDTSSALVHGYEALEQIEIQKTFEDAFPFPVVTEHDAHLAAFCEWEKLSEQEKTKKKCLLALQSIGQGIGSGIIIDGNVLEGAFSIAGELGQIGVNFNGPLNTYGEPGMLESYASSESVHGYIAQRLTDFPDTVLREDSSLEEILEAYKAFDPLAVWAYERIASALSYGLLNAIFLVNPGLIVIGPDYPKTDHFMAAILSKLKGMLHEKIFAKIEIRFSDLDEDATILGGRYYLLDYFEKKMELYERIRQIADTPTARLFS